MSDRIEIRDQRHDFTIIDNYVIELLPEMGANCFAVYCALARFTNRSRRAWPSLQRLADMCKLSRRTVQEHLKRLAEEFHLIEITQLREKGRFRSNCYTLVATPTEYPAIDVRHASPFTEQTAVDSTAFDSTECRELPTNKIYSSTRSTLQQDLEKNAQNARASDTDFSEHDDTQDKRCAACHEPEERGHVPGCQYAQPLADACAVYHPGFPCGHEREALKIVCEVLWGKAVVTQSHPSLHAFLHDRARGVEDAWHVRQLAQWWKANRQPKDWSIPLMFARPEETLATAQATQAPSGHANGLEAYARKLREEQDHATT